MAPPSARLYLLFTPTLCPRDPWQTLELALQGGVQMVQWRVEEQDPAALARCMHVCRMYEVPVLVNDDVDLAVRMGAAGAHVGQDDMPLPEARERTAGLWLGVSTHDLGQIAAAEAGKADYVGFGPCFATETKGYAEGLHRKAISADARRARLPLYAIGGIHARNTPLLQELGVERIAVSRAVLCAEDPRRAAQKLRRILSRT